jgi:hypothetical protein
VLVEEVAYVLGRELVDVGVVREVERQTGRTISYVSRLF